MRRLLMGSVLFAVLFSSRAAAQLYLCPDVPTTESTASTTLLPWTIARYDAAGPSYAAILTVPGNPHVDAIHKLDAVGAWLFSIESPSDLAGALPAPADGRDLVRYDAATGTYTIDFCGGSVADAVPGGSNVDALLVDGSDAGDVWLSFDVPTTIGSITFEPADLVAYRRTAPGCAGWSLAPVNPAFDASAAGTGFPLSSNVVGAAKRGGVLVLTVDVPTDLGPPGIVTFPTSVVLAWDGTSWSGAPLAGWPGSSAVEGLSWVGNPGRVPFLAISKSQLIPGNLELTWTPACSEGATDYGIYEGAIGNWTSHVSIACSDTAGDLTESIAPAGGDRYYLVVPHNDAGEGSYGLASGGLERPVGASACVVPQIVTACP